MQSIEVTEVPKALRGCPHSQWPFSATGLEDVVSAALPFPPGPDKDMN